MRRPTWDEIREHHRRHRDDLGASWWRVSQPTRAELAPSCVSTVRVTVPGAGAVYLEVYRGATVAGADVLSGWESWEPLAEECDDVVAWPVPPPRTPGPRM